MFLKIFTFLFLIIHIQCAPNAVAILNPVANSIVEIGSNVTVRWNLLANSIQTKPLSVQLRNERLAYYLADNIPPSVTSYTVQIPLDAEEGNWRFRVSDPRDIDYGDGPWFKVVAKTNSTTSSTIGSTTATATTTTQKTITTNRPTTTTPPSPTCNPPLGGCYYGSWSQVSCRCICIGEIGAYIGWCRDQSGRCLTLKRYNPLKRQYDSCGELPRAPRPNQDDHCCCTL